MPKITSLDLLDSDNLSEDDLLVVVDDPDGTPVTKKTTVADLAYKVTTMIGNIDWAGAWADDVEYVDSDPGPASVVAHEGSLYICIAAHNSTTADDEPGVGTTWETKWALWVPQGITGATGAQGIEGEPGANGLPSNFVGEYDDFPVDDDFFRGDAVWNEGDLWVLVAESLTKIGSPIVGTVPTMSGSAPGPVDTDIWQRIAIRGAKPWGTPTEWDSGTTYSPGGPYEPADAVYTNPSDGTLYVCIADPDSTNVEPGVDVGWEADWAVALQPSGYVASITGGDHIDVTGTASVPIVSVDVETLASDPAFTEAVVERLGGTAFWATRGALTIDRNDCGSSPSWVSLVGMGSAAANSDKYRNPDLPDFSLNADSVVPTYAGLWRVTINIAWALTDFDPGVGVGDIDFGEQITGYRLVRMYRAIDGVDNDKAYYLDAISASGNQGLLYHNIVWYHTTTINEDAYQLQVKAATDNIPDLGQELVVKHASWAWELVDKTNVYSQRPSADEEDLTSP